MHNIKLLEKNLIFFKKLWSHRNTNINLKSVLDLDKKNRELIQSKEKLEQEKKIISKKKIKVNFHDQKKYQKKLNSLIRLKQKLKMKLKLYLARYLILL